MKLLGMGILRRHATTGISIFATPIHIRTGTPDLRVAHSCLGGEFREALAQTRPTHGFIVDAGGYIGTAAIAFARAFPDSTVVCLEPHPENYALACRNTRDFPNVTVLNKALAPADTTTTLRNRSTGHWGYTTVAAPADARESLPIDDVAAVSIPTLLANFGKDGIDLLKLDIEGAEHDLLAGDTVWIGNTGVIVAELHDRIVAGCTQVFERATVGRKNFSDGGEKIVSVQQRV